MLGPCAGSRRLPKPLGSWPLQPDWSGPQAVPTAIKDDQHLPMMTKTVRILGTHGVPAAYGGFETAAENVAFFLASRGWRVVVYCQINGTGALQEDVWNGLERGLVPIDIAGWRGSSKFDLLTIRHASKHRDLCLTFGDNTAI